MINQKLMEYLNFELSNAAYKSFKKLIAKEADNIVFSCSSHSAQILIHQLIDILLNVPKFMFPFVCFFTLLRAIIILSLLSKSVIINSDYYFYYLDTNCK